MNKNIETFDLENLNYCYYTNLIYNPDEREHRHSFWEIVAILDGTCINNAGGNKTELAVGDVIIMRPNDKHCIKSLKCPYNHRDLYVNDDKMKKICDCFEGDLYGFLMASAPSVRFILSTEELSILENDLLPLNGINKSATPDLENFHTAIIISLLKILLKQKLNFVNAAEDFPPWLKLFVMSLNNVEFLKLSIAEIINQTNYSHGYICSKFKAHMGVTIRDYVNRCKMNYAATLLLNPQLRISDISEILGYIEPANFITAFKREYKITPNGWRKLKFNSTPDKSIN